MAGFAPFGRDDQPLLDIKIVGGKRVEVEVDKYGREVHGNRGKSQFEGTARFSRSLSEEERNTQGFSPPRDSSLPPWAREGTPPNNILKPLIPDRSTSTITSTSSSGSFGLSLPGSPKVRLPPISTKSPNGDANSDAALMGELRTVLRQFDTSKLKEAYMSFAGLDSTLTGFVGAEQVQQVFQRYRVPIQGPQLNSVMAKFMSARRPNWVNYEQMLKFVNDAAKPARSNYFHDYGIPKLDLDIPPGEMARGHLLHSPTREPDITLKPNQVSPRAVNDGSSTGRQSVMAVTRAFQSRQDAQLLIEMERLFKQVPNVQEQIKILNMTLQENGMPNTELMISQKLKTICLRHHLPLNGSLLDKIIDRLDPRNTGKVSWVEFMAFVERAIPLSSGGSSSNISQRGSPADSQGMPPARPTWETRQPIQEVPRRGRVIPEMAALQHNQIYNDQNKILDHQLTEQSEELSRVLNKQQRNLDKRQKALQQDHIKEMHRPVRDYEEDNSMSSRQPVADNDQRFLQERYQTLLRQQMKMIEQKQQQEFSNDTNDDQYGQDGANRPLHGDKESRIERFLRLANALFLCDKDASGLLESDIARRLVQNYNLVYQLAMTAETIEHALRTCSTADDMVSIDQLLEQLKRSI